MFFSEQKKKTQQLNHNLRKKGHNKSTTECWFGYLTLSLSFYSMFFVQMGHSVVSYFCKYFNTFSSIKELDVQKKFIRKIRTSDEASMSDSMFTFTFTLELNENIRIKT